MHHAERDDRVLRLLLPIAVLVAGGCGAEPEPAPRATPPEPTVAAAATTPPGDDGAVFADVTVAVGLDFVHFNHVTGDYLLPEITGSGAALLDHDGDGDLDLYLVQGALLRGDAPARPRRDRLYRNELVPSGELRLVDVTAASGIDATGYGIGVATGDYDGDGRVDLYVTNLGPNQLWRNLGDGRFADVTASAGVAGDDWSSSASFLDFDRDGHLDLFVASYVDFSIEVVPECFAESSARDYCGPDAYAPAVDRLYRGRGDGSFADVTLSAGLDAAYGAGLGVVAIDADDDGWLDLYVANDGDPNQLWRNQRGSGRFVDDALLAGVALNGAGQAEAGMGIAAGDLDGDGREDLFLTHLERESNTLYVSLGEGLFEDRTIASGLHHPSLAMTGFGTSAIDFDNDGWLDLVALNGAVRIVEELARAGEEYPLQQRNQLFRNGGGGRFVGHPAGPAFARAEVSRGLAHGDIDNDGDTDLVIANNHGPARLLRNQVGERSRWLGLRLLEADGRTALGARVAVTGSDGRERVRVVRRDGSYASAGDPRLLIGLGSSDACRAISIRWPDGAVEELEGLALDRYWRLRRGQPPRPEPDRREPR